MGAEERRLQRKSSIEMSATVLRKGAGRGQGMERGEREWRGRGGVRVYGGG